MAGVSFYGPCFTWRDGHLDRVILLVWPEYSSFTAVHFFFSLPLDALEDPTESPTCAGAVCFRTIDLIEKFIIEIFSQFTKVKVKRISTQWVKIWAKLKWGSATKQNVSVGNFWMQNSNSLSIMYFQDFLMT